MSLESLVLSILQNWKTKDVEVINYLVFLHQHSYLSLWWNFRKCIYSNMIG